MAVRCDSLTIDRGGAFGGNRICIKDVFLGLYDGEFASGERGRKIFCSARSLRSYMKGVRRDND